VAREGQAAEIESVGVALARNLGKDILVVIISARK
jgi:hypothetical protein